MEDSTLLYKCPGDNPGPSGTTYNFRGAASQDAADALVQDGWFRSLDEAVQSFLASKPGPAQPDVPMTPEARKAASDKALAETADKSLTANKQLAIDKAAAASAAKTLADAEDVAKLAADALDKATAAFKLANTTRDQAAQRAAVANKALAASMTRAEVCQKLLNDAAGKSLLTDALVADTAKKATDQAEAAARALAAAGGKNDDPAPDVNVGGKKKR